MAVDTLIDIRKIKETSGEISLKSLFIHYTLDALTVCINGRLPQEATQKTEHWFRTSKNRVANQLFEYGVVTAFFQTFNGLLGV